MSKVYLGAALVVILGVASVALAQGPPLVVEGRVVNGTDGGGSVDGLTVVLLKAGADGGLWQATIDASGRFRFDGVEVDATSGYQVYVRYQSALYGTGIDLSSKTPSPTTLTVYESTSDDAVISVASASILLTDADEASGTLGALEIVRIANATDRAYVPGLEPMNLLRFGLPPGAQGLRVETLLPEADHVQVDRGFALLASIPPGEHEVMYTYRFPYSGTRAAIVRSLRYGAGQLRVLAPADGGVKLASEELSAPETVDIGERPYQLLQGTNFSRGTLLSVELTGLPRPASQSELADPVGEVRFEYAAPVVLALLMAALIGLALWRRAADGRRAEAELPDRSGAAD